VEADLIVNQSCRGHFDNSFYPLFLLYRLVIRRVAPKLPAERFRLLISAFNFAISISNLMSVLNFWALTNVLPQKLP